MHNMVVELRSDGYDTNMFEAAKDPTEKGMFLDEQRNEKPFKWFTKERTEEEGGTVTQFDWAKQLSLRYSVIVDEIEHYFINSDLVEHL